MVPIIALASFLTLLQTPPASAHPPAAGSRSSIASFVWGIAADPFSTEVLYAATDIGLWKTTDGGAHWFTALTSPTSAVATDPAHPGTVLAASASGFFRSVDAGASWQPAGEGLSSAVSVTCISVDSQSSVYIGLTLDNPYVPAPQGAAIGVFKSSDQGRTFQPTGLSGLAVGALAIDPSNPQTLYAAPYGVPIFTATNGRGVFKSVDAGATWSPALDLQSYAFRSIVVDPHDGATVYASWTTGTVFRSTDAGATWTQIGFGHDIVGQYPVLAIDTSSPSTLYMATDHGVIKSTNGAVDWTSLSASPQTSLSSLLFDRGRIFAGVGGGPVPHSVGSDIYWSADGGLSWSGSEFLANGTCAPGSNNLCLAGGHFDVRITWVDAAANPFYSAQQPGTPVPLVSNTGAFWFFSPDNLELVIKVLDGRAINGHWWVFYGALSNVEYTITVTDTQTGAVKTYFNPQGQLASVADTEAF